MTTVGGRMIKSAKQALAFMKGERVPGLRIHMPGIIVRLNDKVGFGYVREESSVRQYIFKFCRVPRYNGQSARELGLHIGTHVRFCLEDEIVVSIVPLSQL